MDPNGWLFNTTLLRFGVCVLFVIVAAITATCLWQDFKR